MLKQRGFTLVELMVSVSILSLMLAFAAPSFRSWISNAQVRTTSDALQTGVRQAQSEALRRSQQVVLFRAATATCNATVSASSTGKFWVLRTVAAGTGQTADIIQCGTLIDAQSSVEVSGPAALCFNAAGRQTASGTPGLGGTVCALDASGFSVFNVTSTAAGADRPLQVRVSLGGSVQMCDPAKTFSASVPDGCPA